MKWVGLATLIAWPIAYIIMRDWLGNFAHKISLGWMPFALAAIVSMIIAVLTVSTQAFKAANTDPVDSLKYE
jgi:putative ABC transport system permease protein